MLDWRLDTTGHHSSGQGPVPWIPGVPHVLTSDDTFGSWLTARHGQVADLVTEVTQDVATWTSEDAPPWAQPLLSDTSLLTDVALWRAVEHVPDDEPALTGRPHPAVAARRHQNALDQRVTEVLGPKAPTPHAVATLLDENAPRVREDPWWPVLSERVNLAASGGVDVVTRLQEALEHGPLPDEYPAAALWSRLVPSLAPAAAMTATGGSGANRLRPEWTDAMAAALPDGVAAAVLTSPAWPTLVATVHEAATSQHADPATIITQAVGLLGSHVPHPGQHEPGAVPLDGLATILAWRVADLATAPADPDAGQPAPAGPGDELDPEAEQFAAQLAREHYAQSHPATTAGPPVGDAGTPPTFEPPEPGDGAPEEADLAPEDVPPSTTRDRILTLNRAAGGFYAGQYPGSPAQAYLTDRLGTDLTDTSWQVGYAPQEWTSLADHLRATLDATDDELVDAGLGKYSRRGSLIDIFRARAMLGIRDGAGDLVGFVGRDLTGDSPAKYLNSPATAAFTKGAVLFGLHEATTAQPDLSPGLCVVEGPIDAIALSLAGAENPVAEVPLAGVASMTAGLTDRQADLLTAHCPDRTVWQAPDADTAGQTGLHRDFDKLVARGITPRVVPLAHAKDAAQLWQSDPDVLATILASAEHHPHTAQTVIDHIISDHDPRYVEGRVQAGKQVGACIASLPPQDWDDQIDYAARRFPDTDWSTLDETTEWLYTNVLATALDWHSTDTPPDSARLAEVLHDVGTKTRTADPDRMAARRAAALRLLSDASNSLEETIRTNEEHAVDRPTTSRNSRRLLDPDRARTTPRDDEPPPRCGPQRRGPTH